MAARLVCCLRQQRNSQLGDTREVDGMKWTQLIVGSLCLALVACNGNRGDGTNSSAAGTGNESGSMQNGSADTMDTTGMTGSDTGAMRSSNTDTTSGATGGESVDTARSRATGGTSGTDSAKANQTKSGVTNTKTGKSTTGPGVTQTRPDQGAPVTSKGDTI